MKALIQRVTAAKVTVGEELVSEIGRGLCVLVGIRSTDTEKDLEYICRKILNVRLFEKDGKRWQTSVINDDLEVLCISQFTLYHKLKGNKPDFHAAMQGAEAQTLYAKLIKKLGEMHNPAKIRDGRFGAMMEVHIQNSGPVTIEVESNEASSNTSDVDKLV